MIFAQVCYDKDMDTPTGTVEQIQQQMLDQQAALEQQGVAPQEMPSQREMVHQIVGQQIQGQLPQYAPAAPAPTKPPADPNLPSYMDPQLNQSVQDLVNLAFTKGLPDAIKMLAQAHSDALTDAFHDAIVDELIGQMTEQGKIPKLDE